MCTTRLGIAGSRTDSRRYVGLWVGMILKFILALIFHTLVIVAASAEVARKPTLSGTVTDAVSGQPLVGAVIYVPQLGTGIPTDADGRYSIALPAGRYRFVCSYMGYDTSATEFDIRTDMIHDVALNPKDETIEEVVVTSAHKGENLTRPEMGVQKIQSQTIRSVPVLMGETDLIKVIQLMPGVQAASEGSTGFSVRGGNPDQNLVLIDGATVYNAGHFMGFFSVFNNDAVHDVKLYKGDMPAEHGGRMASLLDVRLTEGDRQSLHGRGGGGLIASRLTVEGPLWKDRTSFIVSGRRTYYDVFLPLSSDDFVKECKIYFYDVNAKICHTFDANNRLNITGYLGRDLFKQPYAEMQFGNQCAAANWNHIFGPQMYMDLTLTAVRSNYRNRMAFDEASTAVWKSVITDYTARLRLTGKSPIGSIDYGLMLTRHNFEPGTAHGEGENALLGKVVMPLSHAWEATAFVQNTQKIGSRLSLCYGLRLTGFYNVGSTTVYTYDDSYEVADTATYGRGHVYCRNHGLEPRLSVACSLTPQMSVKAAYTRTYQYMQQASVSTAGSPLDVWYMTSPNVDPQRSDQFSVGLFRNLHDNDIELSVEAFYKEMRHTIDFKDHPQVMLNEHLEGELRFGSSRAYGVELMGRFDVGRLSGWAGYTLSRADRRIDGVNDGRRYLSPYHHAHDVSIVGNYRLGGRWSVSANWVFISGAPTTFPVARYEVGGDIVPLYASRNTDRMPHYHRLDVSATLACRRRPGRKWQGEWVFSFYNLYNRHNTWTINFERQDSPEGGSGNGYEVRAQNIYLFPIIPSVTYNFKF